MIFFTTLIKYQNSEIFRTNIKKLEVPNVGFNITKPAASSEKRLPRKIVMARFWCITSRRISKSAQINGTM